MSRIKSTEPLRKVAGIPKDLPSPLNRFGVKPVHQEEKNGKKRKTKKKNGKGKSRTTGRDPNRGLSVDFQG